MTTTFSSGNPSDLIDLASRQAASSESEVGLLVDLGTISTL